MTESRFVDDTLDLEIRSQDELGRTIVPSQETPGREDFTLPAPRASMRCKTTERELFKHDFSKDC